MHFFTPAPSDLQHFYKSNRFFWWGGGGRIYPVQDLKIYIFALHDPPPPFLPPQNFSVKFSNVSNDPSPAEFGMMGVNTGASLCVRVTAMVI